MCLNPISYYNLIIDPPNQNSASTPADNYMNATLVVPNNINLSCMTMNLVDVARDECRGVNGLMEFGLGHNFYLTRSNESQIDSTRSK
jgi:hypothetical protein